MARDLPEKTEPAAVYIIAAEMPGGSFVVKIGMTSVPYERYSTLITGIPFDSVMKWSWAGTRDTARIVERSLHRLFADRNTAREWFRFGQNELGVLRDGLSATFFGLLGKMPEWQVITEGELTAFIVSRAKPKQRFGRAKHREPRTARQQLSLHESIGEIAP